MKINFDKLLEYLTEDEFDQLDVYRHHIMRFKGLANDCTTWDEVITALNDRIAIIEALQAQGANLVQNDNDDYLVYEIPNEQAIYATRTDITDTTCTFRLDDGTKLTTPRPDWTLLTDDHLHRRIALLINQTGDIQGISIPTHFES
ncbi:MAG: hypothetical protein ACFFDE_04180 [Promethearchaeota archaeon]